MFWRGALIALAVFLFSPAAKAGVFYPETFTLDNGLQVVVVSNHLAPAVTQMVWYKVGSGDESPGKTGLAHFLEHLMFRGTFSMPPGSFSKKIASQGGHDNAFTSYDYTAYHETIAADRLEMVMRMEADRMQNLRITPVTAAPELRVVLSERQQRTDNNPAGKFEERVRQALLPDYPYGVPVIGWKSEIEKLSAADAEEFYQHHYAPNNAIVVISGDVTADEVRKLAEDIYGKIPRRDVPPRKAFPPLKKPSERRIIATDPGVEQPRLELHTVVPSYSTQENGEAYAYEVLGEALDGGEVGVLFRDLVAGQGIASGLNIGYDPDARGSTLFTIVLVPQPGKTHEALEKALHAALQKLAKQGLDAKLVEDAKTRLMRAAVFGRDSLMAPGYVFGQGLATGHSVEAIESWPDRIGAVTPDQVDAALRALVGSEYNITGILLPDKNASPATRALRRPAARPHAQEVR
ncbi:MAG: M16 family metallopeptidase [Bdellovibrionales bacterium]